MGLIQNTGIVGLGDQMAGNLEIPEDHLDQCHDFLSPLRSTRLN